MLLCVFVAFGTGSLGFAGVAEEYQVKAAFFYHFARFIEWPAATFSSEDEPFRVCIVGKNPFEGELANLLSGKAVHNRSVILMPNVPDSQWDQCHVVFVGDVSADRVKTVTRAFKGKSVLTIGEREDFIRRGGVIRLFMQNNKVRFAINPQAAQQAQLHVSSKLLRLAKIEEP